MDNKGTATETEKIGDEKSVFIPNAKRDNTKE